MRMKLWNTFIPWPIWRDYHKHLPLNEAYQIYLKEQVAYEANMITPSPSGGGRSESTPTTPPINDQYFIETEAGVDIVTENNINIEVDV